MNDSGFVFDTRETEEQVQQAARIFADLKTRLPILMERGVALEDPRPESPLAQVDLLTPYDPLSNQLRNFLTVAVDNIRAVVAHVDATNELPMVALYSMIRSAIEATSYGLWFIGAGKKNKRAFLSLRLAYENNEDLRSLGKVLGAKGTSGQDAVQKRLLYLQSQIPDYSTRDISQRPTTTDVVMEADRHVKGRLFFTGLQVWKACSGLAHGNNAVLREMLERVPTGEHTENGLTFILTSRFSFVAGFLAAAVENIETLIEKYEQACG